MTARPRATRLTLHEPLGMAEPLRPEMTAAIRLVHVDQLRLALDRVGDEDLPLVLGQALARRFGTTKAARIARLAADQVEVK